MTNDLFLAKQEQILDCCRVLLRDSRFEEFNQKKIELIKLQDDYLNQLKKSVDDIKVLRF